MIRMPTIILSKAGKLKEIINQVKLKAKSSSKINRKINKWNDKTNAPDTIFNGQQKKWKSVHIM